MIVGIRDQNPHNYCELSLMKIFLRHDRARLFLQGGLEGALWI